MKRRIGIYLVALAMVLTWVFHIGAAAYAATEWVGDMLAPKQDHVLFWFPFALAGGVFMAALIAGILLRYPPAMQVSALVFVGGAAGAICVHVQQGDYVSFTNRILDLTVAGICLASAFYLWALCRQAAKSAHHQTTHES